MSNWPKSGGGTNNIGVPPLRILGGTLLRLRLRVSVTEWHRAVSLWHHGTELTVNMTQRHRAKGCCDKMAQSWVTVTQRHRAESLRDIIQHDEGKCDHCGAIEWSSLLWAGSWLPLTGPATTSTQNNIYQWNISINHIILRGLSNKQLLQRPQSDVEEKQLVW